MEPIKRYWIVGEKYDYRHPACNTGDVYVLASDHEAMLNHYRPHPPLCLVCGKTEPVS